MPTVNVKRDELFTLIGKTFSDKEFDDLCFQYGIELDDITSEREMTAKHLASSEEAAALATTSSELDDSVIYKIEIPANRYDLLCVEGIARALRVFLQMEAVPTYRVTPPTLTLHQKRETLSIRPFVVAAVLRDITFTQENFASFIDLQDKLHQNIGRKRTLVAIGTHDLDTISAPFSYEALPKKQIRFRPLSEEQEFDGEELFEYYHNKANNHLKPYLHITENAPVQPVIYDAKRVVCSLPPIINGEHSKITLDTKNVFIECTGTDLTKLKVTLNQVVTMFTQYCSKPFEIEQVEILSEQADASLPPVRMVTPDLSTTEFKVKVDYINSAIGINIRGEEMVAYLEKMSMHATLADEHDPEEADEQKRLSKGPVAVLTVSVPPTRSDILHACDLMEDIAISYGYNNVPRTLPQCYTTGKFLRINALTDSIREQVAMAGFNEVLTWVLLSFDDNYRFMQPKEVQQLEADKQDGALLIPIEHQKAPLIVHPYLSTPKPIKLANPKSLDFQMVRTTLLPGLLKALSNNQGQVNLPIRLFESGDVGFRTEEGETDVGARNERRIAALYCDVRSGFEVIQGLLDRIMAVNGVYFAPSVREYRAQRAKNEAKKEAARKAAEAAEKKKAQKAKKAPKGEDQKEDAAPAPAPVAPAADADEESEWKVTDMFYLRASSHPSYFPGRRADVVLQRHAQGDEVVIGTFGILHPDVIAQFQIPYVCSALELKMDYFL